MTLSLDLRPPSDRPTRPNDASVIGLAPIRMRPLGIVEIGSATVCVLSDRWLRTHVDASGLTITEKGR